MMPTWPGGLNRAVSPSITPFHPTEHTPSAAKDADGDR
jgi:hypothetical protein